MFENLFGKTKTETETKHGKLKDIALNEISMVDSPANKQPFLFFKNKKNSLQEVLEAEEFDQQELEEVQEICKQLQEISTKEADAIAILVLASTTDTPAVIVKNDSICLSADLQDDNEVECLDRALEVISKLGSDSLGAVCQLVKLGESGTIEWPSLTGNVAVVVEDDDEPEPEPVKKSGKMWPSLLQHIPDEQEQEVVTKSKALWPSLLNHIA